MPRRGDNIRKRKDGRWEARYLQQSDSNQVKKYTSVYGKTYQEAKEKREQILAHNANRSPTPSPVFFHDVLAAWQLSNQIRLKPSSVSRYQNLIDTQILPSLGDKRMDQLNTSVINRFLTEKLKNGRLDRDGGLSAAYVRSIALVIDSAIAFGATEKMYTSAPPTIAKPPIAKKELSVLEVNQQVVLERELLENTDAAKLLIYITLYTGIRIGEACALRWEDIDLDTRLLYIRHTVSRVWIVENGKKVSRLIISSPKTKSSFRCIPICSKLYETLGKYPYLQKRGYILTNGADKSFMSPRTFEYRYKAILNKCRLTPINYHTLRHTFATRCIERGVDIKSLSEFLGHANVSITLSTYVHSSTEMKRCQIEKLVL